MRMSENPCINTWDKAIVDIVNKAAPTVEHLH